MKRIRRKIDPPPPRTGWTIPPDPETLRVTVETTTIQNQTKYFFQVMGRKNLIVMDDGEDFHDEETDARRSGRRWLKRYRDGDVSKRRKLMLDIPSERKPHNEDRVH